MVDFGAMTLFARIRSRLGPVWGPAFLLFCATRVGDVVNAAVGLWLVPRFCSGDELRAVQPLVRVAAFVATPLALVPAAESVGFYYLTTFTEIATYVGGTVVFVLFPVVSARHERGEGTRRLLGQSMALTLAGGLAVSALLALAGPTLLRAIGAGAYADQARWFFPLGALAAVRTASACFTTHEAACGRFSYLWYTLPVALLETAAVWLCLRGPDRLVIHGWRFAHVYVFMALNTLLSFALILADLVLHRRTGARKRPA